MNIGAIDLGFRKAEMAQHVESQVIELLIAKLELSPAEFLAEAELVEYELDVEGSGEPRLDARDLGLAEALGAKLCMTDRGRIGERAVAHRIGDDRLDRIRRIAERP